MGKSDQYHRTINGKTYRILRQGSKKECENYANKHFKKAFYVQIEKSPKKLRYTHMVLQRVNNIKEQAPVFKRGITRKKWEKEIRPKWKKIMIPKKY